MKILPLILLSVALALVGCAGMSSPVEPAKKEALKKILEPRFEFTSIPSDQEGAFYLALEAFAAGRRSHEFVGTVIFISRSEIQFLFSDGGMHGGGFATLKKKNGRWVVDEKWHNA